MPSLIIFRSSVNTIIFIPTFILFVQPTLRLPGRDGPVSIIYIIIAGIELYNNNGWSIIIFILYIRGYIENLA
jgi:hypothetical protein